MFETGCAARLTSLLRQLPCPQLALDLGCGECPGLSSEQITILGVDHDWASLDRARQQYPAARHLVQADAAHLPFRCQFDLILIRHPNIDHNRTLWKPVIQNAIYWLTEPGVLLITTYSLSEIEDARRWLDEIGQAPVPLDERRLVPAGLDGRDRFVLVYRKPPTSPETRLSATV